MELIPGITLMSAVLNKALSKTVCNSPEKPGSPVAMSNYFPLDGSLHAGASVRF
jgi:hypothetical protein